MLSDGHLEVPFTTDGTDGQVARWTVAGTTTLHIAARFGDVLIREPEPLDVKSVPDAVPLVVLEGAPRRVELADLDRLELRYLAVDDHGLREVNLVLRSGGREERRVLEIRIHAWEGTRHQRTYSRGLRREPEGSITVQG